jgi:sarcosine oxidase subunit beta
LARSVELLPQLKHANIIRTWSGTEGYLPDHEPVIGPSRTTPGLFHGFGFAGAGFQIGPAVGEVLSELATQGKTSTPIDGFSISRFPRVLSSITTTLGDLP